MRERIFNFSAGPAVLPVEVLETVRDNLLNYRGTGLGIMEMSHRGKDFEAILAEAQSNLREMLSIPQDYAIIFTTGGATTQFSSVPMNLLPKGQTADYIITGVWSEKAIAEAKKFGEVHVAATSTDKGFSYIPTSFQYSAAPAYVHFTSNNTIYGTQFHTEPKTTGAPLICDASSDMLHKKIDITKYGFIYAGAQKNLGPAGVTLGIINRSLLANIPAGLPVMMDYRTYVDNDSMYNTIPTFPVYVFGEVLKWIKKHGGLDVMYEANKKKARVIYSAIDNSGFYSGVAQSESRSLMNVTFRLPSEELEKKFVKEADANGLSGLKGHKSAGGIRASIYNAFPIEGCEALAAFMQDFERNNG